MSKQSIAWGERICKSCKKELICSLRPNSCKHYEEREEKCGAEMPDKPSSQNRICCGRTKGHPGDHTREVGNGRYIWSKQPTPTAFDKALVEHLLDSSARIGTKSDFLAGWQARGKHIINDIDEQLEQITVQETVAAKEPFIALRGLVGGSNAEDECK